MFKAEIACVHEEPTYHYLAYSHTFFSVSKLQSTGKKWLEIYFIVRRTEEVPKL